MSGGKAEAENLQADSPLSVEPEAGLYLTICEIMTPAETRSQPLKRLKHPGTLPFTFLLRRDQKFCLQISSYCEKTARFWEKAGEETGPAEVGIIAHNT